VVVTATREDYSRKDYSTMVLIKIRGQIYNLSMLSKAEFTPAGERKGWTDQLKMRFIGCQLLVTGAEARRLWAILESQVHDHFDTCDEAIELELGGPGQGLPVGKMLPAITWGEHQEPDQLAG
jgi:hypothetical protein